MTTSASNTQTASLMLTLSTGLQLLAFFVVLEEQMQKVGDTRSQYNTAAQLMQSNMKMLRMALGKGGG